MIKKIGVQSELNEIAETLILNGFEVTNRIDTSKDLDAIIYYNHENEIVKLNNNVLDTVENEKNILKINAAKTNINQIIEILKSI